LSLAAAELETATAAEAEELVVFVLSLLKVSKLLQIQITQ
jgi:hypothetical protein